MTVHRVALEYDLEAEFDAADLTDDVERIVADASIREGHVTIFSEGATAAVTTIEYESGCLADLERALDEIAPANLDYQHNERWGDGNGFSHLRSALLDPSVSTPVIEGSPGFTTWQHPIVLNFDNRPRTRTVHVTVTGE